MNKKSFSRIIYCIALAFLMLFVVGCGEMTYKYEGDLDYSATITLHKLNSSYNLDYDGDDQIYNKSKKHLTVEGRYMFYEKTVNGEDYYMVSLPSPFRGDYWVLSGDKQKLKYGDLTFYRQ